MKLAIREMLPGDWAAVKEIYKSGIETNLATFQTGVPSYEEWDAAHRRECRLAAVRGERVVGWAALSPVSSRCVYAGVAEVSVYIAPAHRGTGVGQALLNELSRRAERAGIWTLQSGIMRDNAASIGLHGKCGFRMVGYREKIGRDRFGVWRDTVLMEKRCGLRLDRKGAQKVAFICVHNACRSQIAEALGRRLAGGVLECYSAGTEAGQRINPDAVALVKRLYGVDMERTQRCKTLEELPPVDIVATMGCKVRCPSLPCAHREDWGLEDPTGRGVEAFLRVIAEIERRVLELSGRVAAGKAD